MAEVAICDAPSELDEVDVPKPFAIIEKGNDLGGDPDQEETLFPGQCVSQDLGKLPEHKLAHVIDLIRVSHWLRRPTYGQATDFLPVEIGQCNRVRDLVEKLGCRLGRLGGKDRTRHRAEPASGECNKLGARGLVLDQNDTGPEPLVLLAHSAL